MLCELCGQRRANVHETHIITARNSSSRITTKRDLCEVCAGQKTAEQWQADEIERARKAKAQQERRKLATFALHEAIRKALFDAREAELQSAETGVYGSCTDCDWQLSILVIGSKLPDADPMEALFGEAEKGKSHVVRQLTDCEVHIVRWDADPVRLMSHIFAPYPLAGARLDLSERLLLVEGELDLFPNSFRSLTFCHLAASGISLSSKTSGGRIQYQFKKQKPARLADRRS